MKFGLNDSGDARDDVVKVTYGNKGAGTDYLLPIGVGVESDKPYDPAHRPLATEYAVPSRGVNAHGVDSDVRTDEYDPVEREQTPYDSTIAETSILVPVDPIPVTVVHTALRNIVRKTRIIRVFGRNETFTGTNLHVVESATVFRVLPHEEDRVKVTFRVQTVNRDGNDQYAFWVGHSRNEGEGIYLDSSAFIDGASQFEVFGKNQFFAGIVPHGAFAGTPNKCVLSAVVEYEESVPGA